MNSNVTTIPTTSYRVVRNVTKLCRTENYRDVPKAKARAFRS